MMAQNSTFGRKLARLMATTALSAPLVFAAHNADANEYSVNGGPPVVFAPNTNPWPVVTQPIVFTINTTQTFPIYTWAQSLIANGAPVTYNINAPINSTALEGIYPAVWGGSAVTYNVNSNVTAPGIALRTHNNFGFITPGGSTVIQGAGNITSTASDAINLLQGDAAVNINTSGNITGATSGIVSVSLDAATPGTSTTNITTTGVVTGTSTAGIHATTSRGNITVSGGGTGSVIAGDDGVTVISNSGNVAVNNFASITAGDAGIWAPVSTGNIDVQGNGSITGTARYGVLLGGGTGNINIGNVTTNGPITGGLIGIDARTAGSGNINLTTDRNVTGNGNWGAYLSTLNGNVTSNINAGTVSGVIRGYEAQIFGSGNAVTNIAAGAIVQASAAGGYGLLTGVTGGLATTNNAGIIRNATDSGAAGVAGGDAIWNYFGANVVNNTGQIIGRKRWLGKFAQRG